MVTQEDLVVADDDGVLFLAAGEAEEALRIAAEIVAAERAQAERLGAGGSPPAPPGPVLRLPPPSARIGRGVRDLTPAGRRRRTSRAFTGYSPGDRPTHEDPIVTTPGRYDVDFASRDIRAVVLRLGESLAQGQLRC